MTMSEVHPTLSPSMDIQVSSNFERLLFELYGRRGHRVAAMMAAFRADGRDDGGRRARSARCGSAGVGARLDDEQTQLVMKDVYERLGVLLDPHTAVGVGRGGRAATGSRRADGVSGHRPSGQVPRRRRGGHRGAAAAAAGPGRPARSPERFDVLPDDLAAVRAHIDRRSDSGLPPGSFHGTLVSRMSTPPRILVVIP